MAYKQSPFPLIDGTKKTKEAVSKVLRTINPLGAKLSKNLDIKGYLKGEQGYIPDWKGESTKETVHKVAKKVAKRTAPKKQKKTKKNLDHLKVVPENRGINWPKPEPVGDKLLKGVKKRIKIVDEDERGEKKTLDHLKPQEQRLKEGGRKKKGKIMVTKQELVRKTKPKKKNVLESFADFLSSPNKPKKKK